MIKTSYVCDFCGKVVTREQLSELQLTIRNLGYSEYKSTIYSSHICNDCYKRINFLALQKTQQAESPSATVGQKLVDIFKQMGVKFDE